MKCCSWFSKIDGFASIGFSNKADVPLGELWQLLLLHSGYVEDISSNHKPDRIENLLFCLSELYRCSANGRSGCLSSLLHAFCASYSRLVLPAQFQ